jgi:endonuclease/exonuclease/phosphatase family metal-dependent hydrolase
VRAREVDVVACQELTSPQAEALARVLPHGGLEPDDRGYRGTGIALRHPARFGRLPLCYRDASVAHLDPADWPELAAPLELLNVHLSSPTHPPFWRQPGRRWRQVRGLLLYLDGAADAPRALVGDLNATPLWPAYRRLAARLDDLALAAARARGARPERTWRRWVGGPRLLRIDHCLGRRLVAHRVEVLDVAGSDHCALLAEVDVAADEDEARHRHSARPGA